MTIPASWMLSRAVAIEAATAGGRAALRHFRRPGLTVERKADASPVTIADREAEAACRATISAAYPTDGWMGEETGATAGSTPRRWIVDPIDGTRNFTRGIPLWSTLVACEEIGPEGPHVIAACATFPVLGECYDAVRGGGARCNGEAIHVSTIDRLADSLVCYYTMALYDRRGYGDMIRTLTAATAMQRGGGDAYLHMLVASGRAELAVEVGLQPWDIAATGLIVSEAGGQVSDLAGRSDYRAGDVVLSNGRVHQAALAITAAPPRP